MNYLKPTTAPEFSGWLRSALHAVRNWFARALKSLMPLGLPADRLPGQAARFSLPNTVPALPGLPDVARRRDLLNWRDDYIAAVIRNSVWDFERFRHAARSRFNGSTPFMLIASDSFAQDLKSLHHELIVRPFLQRTWTHLEQLPLSDIDQRALGTFRSGIIFAAETYSQPIAFSRRQIQKELDAMLSTAQSAMHGKGGLIDVTVREVRRFCEQAALESTDAVHA